MAWTPLHISEYVQELERLPADQKILLEGWPPAEVARMLGISRSAVSQAISRGKLKGYQIVHGGKTLMRIIPEKSVIDYENSEVRHTHTPKKYRKN